LPYYRAVIEYYVGDALKSVMPGQINAAVQQTTILDPITFLSKTTWRQPLLSLYPVSGTEVQHTLEYQRIDTRYRLAYVLPALTAEQAERVMPVLVAIRQLLSVVTIYQGDPAHEAGEKVFINSGVLSVSPGNWEIATLITEQGQAGTVGDFPALLMDLMVQTRQGFDSDLSVTLDHVLAALDMATEGEIDVTDFVQDRSDVPQ
jgi:hypothetical protein